MDFQPREAYNGGKMSRAGIEREGSLDPEQQGGQPFAAGVFIELAAYSQVDYQRELTQLLSSPQPQEIQATIASLDEQIQARAEKYQGSVEPLQRDLAVLSQKEAELRFQKEDLRERITRGGRLGKPTGGDFKTEAKIIWGRIQVRLWQWNKKPANTITKILGKVLAPLAQKRHPLLVDLDRKLAESAVAKGVSNQEIVVKHRAFQTETAVLANSRTAAQKELDTLLEAWVLQDSGRLIFYLLENPGKISGFLEKYSRSQLNEPEEKWVFAYLTWNLKAGFSLENGGSDFQAWSRRFLPQRRLEDWHTLFKENPTDLNLALRENLANFPSFFSQHPSAHGDFRRFLEYCLKAELNKAGLNLENAPPQPYFVSSQTGETVVFPKLEGVIGEQKRVFELVIQGEKVDVSEEERLGELVENLLDQKGNSERERIIKALKALVTALAVQKKHRGFGKLATPVGGANYRLKVGKRRVLIRWRRGVLEVLGIEFHDNAYRG